MRLINQFRGLLGIKPRSPGAEGERIAEKHLHASGYRTIARNLASKHGEIDLLMTAPDGNTLVFVEVKSAMQGRGSAIPPEMRVGKQKQRKVAELAARLIARRKLTGRPIRLDVVGVTLHTDRDAEVRHYPGAFESPW